MSNINITLRADQLGIELNTLADEVCNEIEAAVENVVKQAYAEMHNKAHKTLGSNYLNYAKGLSYTQLGKNDYLIHLDGEFANKLEEGYGAYSLRDTLLNSNATVKAGARTGQPWVQISKEGNKFAHVPFKHNPFSKLAESADLSAAIKKMKATNANGLEQKLTKIFKDIDGNPIAGKVATVESDTDQLNKLTKYQSIYTSKTGKESVQSLYVTYRTISEKTGDWIHPGFPQGLQSFIAAEAFIEREIDNILRILAL